MSKQMDQIEGAFRVVAEALKNGKFTRAELDGIKLFAEHVVGSTDRALARGPLDQQDDRDE